MKTDCPLPRRGSGCRLRTIQPERRGQRRSGEPPSQQNRCCYDQHHNDNPITPASRFAALVTGIIVILVVGHFRSVTDSPGRSFLHMKRGNGSVGCRPPLVYCPHGRQRFQCNRNPIASFTFRQGAKLLNPVNLRRQVLHKRSAPWLCSAVSLSTRFIAFSGERELHVPAKQSARNHTPRDPQCLRHRSLPLGQVTTQDESRWQVEPLVGRGQKDQSPASSSGARAIPGLVAQAHTAADNMLHQMCPARANLRQQCATESQSMGHRPGRRRSHDKPLSPRRVSDGSFPDRDRRFFPERPLAVHQQRCANAPRGLLMSGTLQQAFRDFRVTARLKCRTGQRNVFWPGKFKMSEK